jgi:membrane protein
VSSSPPVAADPPHHDARPAGAEPRSSTWYTLRRSVSEFLEDGLTDWAAALTYYGLLSLFPALLVLSSLIGLFADPDAITDIVVELAPASAADALAGPIDSITSNPGAAGLALVLGLAGALWGASGYIAAFGRASNVIYETREGRPFWKLRPLQMLITLAMALMLAVVVLAIVLTGPVVEAIAEPLGIGATAVSAWDYAKWPFLALAVVAMLTLLHLASPNVHQRGVRAVLPGVLVGLGVWLVASVGFAVYVSNFASYDRTYGSLGGVVVLLVWLWITNVALLLGAELNAERERSREIAEGVPGARHQIQLERREEPGPPTTE